MKDNRSKYWFKRRRYGYGWIPSSWQGWLTLGVCFAVVLGGIFFLRDAPRNQFSPELAIYVGAVLIAIGALVIISSAKGPAPKWRWGKTDKDNPDEDA